MLSRADELTEFKRIDFPQYLATCGFTLDRKQSSRNSVIMRHPNGDKLVIKRNTNGHYVYFNAKGSDRGSIIDFLQSRERLSIGEVRKRLRPWLNGSTSPSFPSPPLPFDLQPVVTDFDKVQSVWNAAQPLRITHPYLEYERRIPRSLLLHPSFADLIRIDRRGNALFGHLRQGEICGFEVKNKNWTGFSPSGTKGLAISNCQPDDHTLVICETAIDLLSYAALHGLERTRYASTAGQISPAQAEDLQASAAHLPTGSTIILACDHDEGGRALTARIREVLADGPHVIREHCPPRPGEDWNDVLRQSTNTTDHKLVMS